MLTIVNEFQSIIFDIAHTVYITFAVFWNFFCKHYAVRKVFFLIAVF